MPSRTPVNVAIIADLHDVPADGLDAQSQPHLYDRIEWFRRTWAHCPPTGRPLIVRASTDARSAWMFLVAQPAGHAVALASWYTLAFRPVFTGKPDTGTQAILLAAAARQLKREIATLTLAPLPLDAAGPLATAFGDAGWLVRRTPHVASWTITVAGKDFAQFWAERPGQLRSTVKRKSAKAALDITITDTFDDTAWADYVDVYADSWKPEEGAIEFLKATAMSKGSSGRLRLGLAKHEGRTVAAQFWTVENGIAIIHKLAHREDCVAMSPGTLLSKAMFEHVIDRDHVSLIDFGTGDDRYKADWMDTRTMLERLEFYNPVSPRGLFAAARAAAVRLAARVRSR